MSKLTALSTIPSPLPYGSDSCSQKGFIVLVLHVAAIIYYWSALGFAFKIGPWLIVIGIEARATKIGSEMGSLLPDF